MEEWKEYKLGEICTKIGSGATPKGGKESYLGGGISLIRSQNVLDFTFSLDGLAFINDEQASKLDGVEIYKGDVLLNITGDSVARCCIVPDSVLPARVNQHVSIVRGDKTKVLNEYILYYLQYKKQLLLSLSQGGATRNALTKGMIEEFRILLPSIDEQSKIVSILKSLDDKIENNRKINENLEQQAQALFKSWFVDFEPFRDQPFVESELGMIPEGWRVEEIGNISRLNAGGDKPQIISNVPLDDCNIPIYSNGLESKGLYGYTNEARISEPAVTISARGTIGDVNLRLVPFCPIVRLISVIPQGIIHVYFLYYSLKCKRIEGVGTTQQQLTVPNFKKEKIVVPEAEKIDRFAKIIDPIIKQMGIMDKEIIRLSLLRDTLLPKLMSGEIKL